MLFHPSSITADFTLEGVNWTPNASSLDALVIQMQSNTGLNAANVQIEKVDQTKSDLLKQMV